MSKKSVQKLFLKSLINLAELQYCDLKCWLTGSLKYQCGKLYNTGIKESFNFSYLPVINSLN
jgi:hypothetical protein